MADDGGGGEKTEEATPEKLRKLRKDGNVAKSQDVITAISFVCVFCILAGAFRHITDYLIEFVLMAIKYSGEHRAPQVAASHLFTEGLITMMKASAPVMAGAFVLGLAMNVAQVGFMFTLKPITPDINKINPISGFKNMFNMKKVVELLKTIVKFILISYISYQALRKHLRDVTMIIRSDLFVGVKVVGDIIWDFCTKIGFAFVVIAGFDAFYQRRKFLKDNMMTKHDVKQEYKQSEGDPHHKAERKRLHHEILAGGGGKAVKGADVVVRNPDHIAVALKYDKEKDSAPTVVAKGERLWAEKILDAARQYNVPIVRNVPLAQALNKLDVGDDIPEELYEAVAEVLTFVYSLSEAQKKKGTKGKPGT